MIGRYTGGSAFPLPKGRDVANGEKNGMTLRDYFAGDAMTGLIFGFPRLSEEEVAKHSYRYADAMLKEREK